MISLILGQGVLADSFEIDAEALSHAREAAKELAPEDLKEIILHPSMANCMERLVSEAKKHDRKGRGLESAVWVIKADDNTYSCHFWEEELRVPGGFDWDGYLPSQTIFSIHTHPKKSGGPRPSESDFEFNKGLGIIGVILSFNRKMLSVNYPGEKSYPTIIKSKTFRSEFKEYY
ncbi:MAG: hypothetical protein ACJAT2_002147 [Bacteriovoracaceae bacterium]|jgi:hypothetical protein